MGYADKFNKGVNKFTYQTDQTFEFYKLGELLEENGGDEVYTLRGLWINTGGMYGDSPVAVIEDRYVNLPNHMLDTVREMIADDEAVELINAGKIGFKIYSYAKTLKVNKKEVDKICYSINFVDIQ